MEMEHKRHFGSMLSAVILLFVLLCGCSSKQEDIVILYTNDVHCAVDEQIGYAGLTAYKKHMEEKTPYVALVDCGDVIQGKAIGMVSQGAYPVEIMNRMGYDFAVLGNHEFDYGMEQLGKLLESSKVQYLGCNIRYSGEGENAVGENGGFLQVSGITFMVDTSVESSVVLDDNGMFVSCGDTRRVKDVRVLQSDGHDAPLDPAKTYTLAWINEITFIALLPDV